VMAAGRLVGLDAHKMVYAAGIAATQASGLREGFGTMTKPFHPGRASQSGVMAALLADGGFTATTQAIEGERGFARAFSEHPQLFKATEELGDRWEILSNGLKLYSCGMATHSLIDAAVSLRSEEGVNFSRANLQSANLRHANLTRANLSGANLQYADLTGAKPSSGNITFDKWVSLNDLPSPNNQHLLPSGVGVLGIDIWIQKLADVA